MSSPEAFSPANAYELLVQGVVDFLLTEHAQVFQRQQRRLLFGHLLVRAPGAAEPPAIDGHADLKALAMVGALLVQQLVDGTRVEDFLGVLLEDCLRPWAPPEAGRLVAALTAREPDRRPPSAAAALALLEPGRPGDAAPTAPIAPRLLVTRRRWRRRAIAVAAVVALALAVAVPLAVVGAGGSARPRPAPVATQPATAPLDRQIDGLERSVRALARPSP